mgnify:CR=1 FL=1
MDWGAALSAVATAVGIAKDLREIDQGLDKAAMKARLADVISNLADVRIALTDAREEMRERDAEVDRLRRAFEFRSSLVEKDGYKFEPFPDGTPKGEPFCPRCEQNLGRFYRLNSIAGYSKYGCPECKSTFQHVPVFLWEKQET